MKKLTKEEYQYYTDKIQRIAYFYLTEIKEIAANENFKSLFKSLGKKAKEEIVEMNEIESFERTTNDHTETFELLKDENILYTVSGEDSIGFNVIGVNLKDLEEDTFTSNKICINTYEELDVSHRSYGDSALMGSESEVKTLEHKIEVKKDKKGLIKMDDKEFYSIEVYNNLNFGGYVQNKVLSETTKVYHTNSYLTPYEYALEKTPSLTNGRGRQRM